MNISELYTYKATVVRVLDGDTAELIIDLGFTVKWKSTCRFYGINTPELNSKDENERMLANAAKDFTKKYLNDGSVILIKSKALDKYGRPLVDIYCGENYNIHLNDELIKADLAKIFK